MEVGNSFKCLFILYFANTYFAQDSGCHSRDYGNGGTVCVCTGDYCDKLPKLKRIEAPIFQIFTSNKDGLRMNRTEGTFRNSSDIPRYGANEFSVNRTKTYQTILGFGGAFTDAFGINMKSLNENAQRNLMRSYFSEDGSEYSLSRITIGGSDFSERGYSFDDTTNPDPELIHFNLTMEDFQYKIPYVKEAIQLSNNKLRILGAAWVAPKWMKTNNEYAKFGAIKKDMYEVWANYHIKFLEAYKEHNISIWGISTGNEPALGLLGSDIPSSAWLPNDVMVWIGDNLGPAIRNSKFPETKLLIIDDQRPFLLYVDWIFTNQTVKNFVDYIAVHWYADDITPIVLLDYIHKKYPDKPLMATEACIGDNFWEPHVLLGSWQRGERYAKSIIDDVNHHMTSWVDWNLALNTIGGPTFINNNVDSPIIVNATAGEFYKQPTYYALAHFSKFVPYGSSKIDLQGWGAVLSTAFLRPDGGTVLVFLNQYDQDLEIDVLDQTHGRIDLTLSSHSITTVVYY